MFQIGARVIGKNLVDAKILAAAPRILEQNAAMVKGMLEYIKPLVAEATPLGPGHFGYHLRDRFTTEVKAEGVRTVGVLKSPPTGYWREFGTQSHFHNAHGRLRSYVAAIGGFGGGGERAFMTAHKAASGVQRLIKFYYGGLAAWWRA